MRIGYLEPRVQLEPEERNLRIRFELENNTSQTFPRGNGFAIGCQVYDPENGMFVAEGDWVALEEDLPPGRKQAVDIRLQLPAERGSYRVYVSPIEEQGGWFHQRGLPFLLVDASVENRKAELIRSVVTTARGVRREGFRRGLKRLLTYPVLTVWRNRSLIRSMVRRDISARYRGSFGDVLWTILNPLLLMATYFFVFGVVLRSRFEGDPSRSGFALYFLAGMLPWLAFSEAAGRAPSVVLEHRNFVKKLVFPIETLPVNQVIAGLVTEMFALAVFLVILLVTRGRLPVTILWLPVLLIPQILFTLGVSWFLAGLGAFVRDLGQVIGFLLTLWFFLTPICYPETSLHGWTQVILGKNPIFTLVRGYRSMFLEHHAPEWHSLWKLWILSMGVCLLGHAWFFKLRKSFADVI